MANLIWRPVRLTFIAAAISLRVRREKTDLRRFAASLGSTSALRLKRKRTELSACAARLNALSPLAVLGRGYAVARDKEGHTLTSVHDFQGGMEFLLLLRDGSLDAVAREIK